MKKIWLLISLLIVIYIWYWVVLTSFSVNVTAKEQCYNETFECYRKCWTEKNRRSCLLFKQWYWKWIFLWWYSFVEAKIKDISNNEEFSEYWLLQWPNGTITLEDFKKEWNIYSWDVWNEVFYKWIVWDTPENAAVMLVFKPDEILYTPYEKNTVLPENHEWDIWFWTNLETFRKVTWLKEASPEYVGYFDWIYIFNPYAKFYKIKEQKEPIIEEPIVSNQKSTWEEIAYTDKYDITLTKKWRTDWDKENWPFYSWISTFLTKELDNWYEYYYDIPRWSWKNKHIIIAFDSDEYIWESDLDLSNTEYILNTFEERNPYYPYFLIPKIWFTWTVDYMQLWEDFEIECRDIDHLLDLDKRNCNLWKEMDKSESPFSLKDWTSIERLDDSDWCDKFKWYENRYIIKNTDIWCWIWVNNWTKVKSIYYK